MSDSFKQFITKICALSEFSCQGGVGNSTEVSCQVFSATVLGRFSFWADVSPFELTSWIFLETISAILGS